MHRLWRGESLIRRPGEDQRRRIRVGETLNVRSLGDYEMSGHTSGMYKLRFKIAIGQFCDWVGLDDAAYVESLLIGAASFLVFDHTDNNIRFFCDRLRACITEETNIRYPISSTSSSDRKRRTKRRKNQIGTLTVTLTLVGSGECVTPPTLTTTLTVAVVGLAKVLSGDALRDHVKSLDQVPPGLLWCVCRMVRRAVKTEQLDTDASEKRLADWLKLRFPNVPDDEIRTVAGCQSSCAATCVDMGRYGASESYTDASMSGLLSSFASPVSSTYASDANHIEDLTCDDDDDDDDEHHGDASFRVVTKKRRVGRRKTKEGDRGAGCCYDSDRVLGLPVDSVAIMVRRRRVTDDVSWNLRPIRSPVHPYALSAGIFVACARVVDSCPSLKDVPARCLYRLVRARCMFKTVDRRVNIGTCGPSDIYEAADAITSAAATAAACALDAECVEDDWVTRMTHLIADSVEMFRFIKRISTLNWRCPLHLRGRLVRCNSATFYCDILGDDDDHTHVLRQIATSAARSLELSTDHVPRWLARLGDEDAVDEEALAAWDRQFQMMVFDRTSVDPCELYTTLAKLAQQHGAFADDGPRAEFLASSNRALAPFEFLSHANADGRSPMCGPWSVLVCKQFVFLTLFRRHADLIQRAILPHLLTTQRFRAIHDTLPIYPHVVQNLTSFRAPGYAATAARTVLRLMFPSRSYAYYEANSHPADDGDLRLLLRILARFKTRQRLWNELVCMFRFPEEMRQTVYAQMVEQLGAPSQRRGRGDGRVVSGEYNTWKNWNVDGLAADSLNIYSGLVAFLTPDASCFIDRDTLKSLYDDMSLNLRSFESYPATYEYVKHARDDWMKRNQASARLVYDDCYNLRFQLMSRTFFADNGMHGNPEFPDATARSVRCLYRLCADESAISDEFAVQLFKGITMRKSLPFSDDSDGAAGRRCALGTERSASYKNFVRPNPVPWEPPASATPSRTEKLGAELLEFTVCAIEHLSQSEARVSYGVGQDVASLLDTGDPTDRATAERKHAGYRGVQKPPDSMNGLLSLNLLERPISDLPVQWIKKDVRPELQCGLFPMWGAEYTDGNEADVISSRRSCERVVRKTGHWPPLIGCREDFVSCVFGETILYIVADDSSGDERAYDGRIFGDGDWMDEIEVDACSRRPNSSAEAMRTVLVHVFGGE